MWPFVNKQVKAKSLAGKINVRVEHIKHPKTRGSFLKPVKENHQKGEEAKGKGAGFNRGASLLCPERHLATVTGREQELLSLCSAHPQHNGRKII